MITSDMIPDEVVEAATLAIFRTRYSFDPLPHQDDHQMELCGSYARASIAAALNAWPGMHHYEPNAEPYYGKHLILPLPQEENPDDQA